MYNKTRIGRKEREHPKSSIKVRRLILLVLGRHLRYTLYLALNQRHWIIWIGIRSTFIHVPFKVNIQNLQFESIIILYCQSMDSELRWSLHCRYFLFVRMVYKKQLNNFNESNKSVRSNRKVFHRLWINYLSKNFERILRRERFRINCIQNWFILSHPVESFISISAKEISNSIQQTMETFIW